MKQMHVAPIKWDSSQYWGEAMGIFDHYQRRYEAAREEEYTSGISGVVS